MRRVFQNVIAPLLSGLNLFGSRAENAPIDGEVTEAQGVLPTAPDQASGQKQPATSPGRWLFVTGTHQGDRENNEDLSQVFKPIVLPDGRIIYITITADGMGGQDLGEEWARILCATVEDCWEQLREQACLPSDWPRSWAVPTLRQANAAIVRKKAALGLAHLQTGTTGTLAIYLEDGVHTFHVGDSPALLFDGTGLEQFTQDHNLYSLLRAQLGPEAEIQAKFKSVLAAYIGDPGDANLAACDHNPVHVSFGGGVLITTDGLLNEISLEEIAAILRLDEPLEHKRDRLIARYDAAPKRHRDNATFVIGMYVAA